LNCKNLIKKTFYSIICIFRIYFLLLRIKIGKEKKMSQRVAVVTGSNKGIGLAIVKGLASIFDGIIYLTGKLSI
jgi:hypothetical protein